MQKPLEICLRHLDPRLLATLEPVLQARAARLERFVTDIVGCRVVLEQPQRGHHSHNPYRVRLRVTVPPHRRLVVAHRPPDPRATLLEVVEGAFDAMERQLDGFAERRRLDVKNHTRARPVVH